MKGRWLAGVACLAVLASCEKPETDTARNAGEPKKTSSTERGLQSQPSNGGTNGATGTNGNGGTPPKSPETPPGAPEKGKEPVAEAIADRPGYVLSPYDGKVIDVRGLPPGTLVQDPSFPMEEKKFFRVPQPPPPPVTPVVPPSGLSTESYDPDTPHPEDDGALGQ